MRWVRALALVPLLLLSACGSGSAPVPLPSCTGVAPALAPVVLDPEQGGNAATIAAVGRGTGLPAHAVTVALATAIQESGLRNLDYGDRDSLGLFQQRPSQGWGTAAQVQDPVHAARAFYAKLAKVPGWADLPVTQAAQAVQRSAFPAAYGDHEADARVLAQALTGQLPAAFACSALPPAAGLRTAPLRLAAAREIGPTGLRPSTSAAAWAAASWLVAHAEQYGVTSVSARGQRWTAAAGRWAPDPAAGQGLSYR